MLDCWSFMHQFEIFPEGRWEAPCEVSRGNVIFVAMSPWAGQLRSRHRAGTKVLGSGSCDEHATPVVVARRRCSEKEGRGVGARNPVRHANLR
jgi:hypothetical protein